VAAALADLPVRLPTMRECLKAVTPPEAEPGSRCESPYSCEFWDPCTAHKPADWVSYMPRLSPAQADGLKARGIEAISAIPQDFPLTARQTVIRDAVAEGRHFVAPDLARLLHGYGPPACYLDFEAMMPPIPLYQGTRPYQTIPFQWSLHTLAADGSLHHRDFLAAGDDDPRRAFAETLIEALSHSDAPIIVYSHYEQTRLKELAIAFADLRDSLIAIIGRLVDLLPIVRGAVYFPDVGFSNSIKSVGPAICPDFTYDDLEDVADGAAASAAFLQLASGRLTVPEDVDRLRSALLVYCRRDTLAMVEVHRALMRLAESSNG
jgi:predicted RecB family nuclease